MLAEDTNAKKKGDDMGTCQIPRDQHLQFSDPYPDDADVVNTSTTTSTMEHMIAERLGRMFHDLHGVHINVPVLSGTIEPDASKALTVDLYFVPNNDPVKEGEIRNILDLNNKEEVREHGLINVHNLMSNLSNATSGRRYTIDDTTRHLLGWYVPTGYITPRNNNWNSLIREFYMPTGYNTGMYKPNTVVPMVRVSGLSLNKLVQHMLPTSMVVKTETVDGNEVHNTITDVVYGVSAIKCIDPTQERYALVLSAGSPTTTIKKAAEMYPQVRFNGAFGNYTQVVRQ